MIKILSPYMITYIVWQLIVVQNSGIYDNLTCVPFNSTVK